MAGVEKVEVEAMAMAPVPTPQVLWRKPPVLALAALPGTSPTAQSRTSFSASLGTTKDLAGCDVQARLGSRSCGSFRPTRPAHRRPRHRTCRDGPPLRLPYASTSASRAFADLLLFLNGASLAARRRIWISSAVTGPSIGRQDRPVGSASGRISRSSRAGQRRSRSCTKAMSAVTATTSGWRGPSR